MSKKKVDVVQKIIWCQQKQVDAAQRSVWCQKKKWCCTKKSNSRRQKQDDAAQKNILYSKNFIVLSWLEKSFL